MLMPTPSGELILIKAGVFLEVIYMVIDVLCCLYILYVNIHSHNADNGRCLYLINIARLLLKRAYRHHWPFKVLIFYEFFILIVFTSSFCFLSC